MPIELWADVALACELDLNKTVGGLGKLDTTMGHRPGRFQWGHGRLQEQSKHRTNIARGARARVLSSDATAVPDHADDFCAQLDAFTGLFFVFLFCSDIVVHIIMALCFNPFSILSLRSSRRELRRDMHNVKRVRSRHIFTLPRFLR